MRYLFLVAALLLLPIQKFCHKQTGGFQTFKICSTEKPSAEWETGPWNEEDLANLKNVLSQPFHYLKTGGQCYAFVSEDQHFVIKFFKMHHLKQYSWLSRLPLPGVIDRYRTALLLQQKQKLEGVFSSCKIAFSQLKEETGLVSINLNCPPELASLNVTLVDKIKIKHRVNLSHVPFIIQYKADKPLNTLRSYVFEKDLDAAKNLIKNIVGYFENLSVKGIRDIDPAVHTNIGLLHNRVIGIDIGTFRCLPRQLSSVEAKEEMLHNTYHLRSWLSKNSEDLTLYYDSLINEYASQGQQ